MCCSIYFFLNSANLCLGTDIIKYYRESLGLQDINSRLYVKIFYCVLFHITGGLPSQGIFIAPDVSVSNQKDIEFIHSPILNMGFINRGR